MIRLALYMLLNLAGSFFCSLAEAAVLASSEARIRSRLEQGLKGSRRLLALRRNPGRTLASIVFLNNVFAIAGTAVLTSMAADLLPEEGPAMLVFITIQTGVVIAFGEILPKVLGEANPEPIASAVVGLLLWIGRAMAPLIWLVDLVVSWARPKQRMSPGREGEIVELARMGRDVGHLDPQEAELIHRIFRLDDITAWDVMTPRYLVRALAGSETLGNARRALLDTTHGQIPVYERDLDKVTGILVLRDALAALARGEESRRLGELTKPALFVPATRTVDDVLRDLQAAHGRMAVVVDEYGVTQGVITMDDLVEELVGEAIDAKELAQGIVKRLNRTQALVHGLNRVRDVARFLNVPLELDTHADESNTVNGLLQERLGRIPEVGDRLEVPGGLLFEVQSTDGRMAVRVLASNRAPPPGLPPAPPGTGTTAAP
jgi:CBS domain containing-hemolysin-like protein